MDTCNDIGYLKKALEREMYYIPDSHIESMQKNYRIEVISKRIKELEDELADLK
jgi:hypothetical protein